VEKYAIIQWLQSKLQKEWIEMAPSTIRYRARALLVMLREKVARQGICGQCRRQSNKNLMIKIASSSWERHYC